MAWVAEDDFDSYSTGDLNTKNGGTGWSGAWSGDTDFDVVTTAPYEGANHVTAVNANGNITRSLTTSVTSGVVYFAMRSTTGGGDAQIDFKNAGTVLRFSMRDSSGNKALAMAAVNTTIISGFSTSIWYLFEVTFNGDDTFNVRYHDGSSWSTPVTNLASGSAGAITSIGLNHGGAQTVYHDYISPTNPLTTSVTVSPSAQVDTFSIPSYTVKRGWVTFPAAQVGTFSTPAPTVSLPKVVSVTPQTATFSIPSYSVLLSSVLVTPSAQTVTFSIPAYQVKTYVLVMPNGQTLTFDIPAYTIIIEANITITPTTLVLTFVTPSRTKVGAVWVKRGRSTNATWVKSTRNSN